MSEELQKKYIRREDFENSKEFLLRKKHIDICLKLVLRLIQFNKECQNEVVSKINTPNYIIDFRQEQFGYYEGVLKSVYYQILSLKDVFTINTLMNIKGIDGGILNTFDFQRRYITFSLIVMLDGIMEYNRKEFEFTGKQKYFDRLKEKYPKLAESLILLRSFRNTIHSNSKWQEDKDLVYKLKGGFYTVKKGKEFVYDHWTLYKIIRDSIELHKFLALDNPPAKIRDTRRTFNGQRLSVIETNLKDEDWDKIFNRNNLI